MSIKIEELRNEIIGINTMIETPYGQRLITYADYTASGKTLKFIEKYMSLISKWDKNNQDLSHFEISLGLSQNFLQTVSKRD